jgi:hypothetical protein
MYRPGTTDGGGAKQRDQQPAMPARKPRTKMKHCRLKLKPKAIKAAGPQFRGDKTILAAA